MAAFYCHKRHWDASKGLLPQATTGGCKVASIENLHETLTESYTTMLALTTPLGTILSDTQLTSFKSDSTCNINHLFFKSIMQDLLGTKPEWTYSNPRSWGTTDNDSDQEQEVPKKKAKTIASTKKETVTAPTFQAVWGQTRKEKLQNAANSASKKPFVPQQKKPIVPLQQQSRLSQPLKQKSTLVESDDEDFIMEYEGDSPKLLSQSKNPLSTNGSKSSNASTPSKQSPNRQSKGKMDSLQGISSANSTLQKRSPTLGKSS